jgi:hypothetical protein
MVAPAEPSSAGECPLSGSSSGFKSGAFGSIPNLDISSTGHGRCLAHPLPCDRARARSGPARETTLATAATFRDGGGDTAQDTLKFSGVESKPFIFEIDLNAPHGLAGNALGRRRGRRFLITLWSGCKLGLARVGIPGGRVGRELKKVLSIFRAFRRGVGAG